MCIRDRRASLTNCSRLRGPMQVSRKQLTAELLLVLVAIIWGWTFVLVKDALDLYPTLPFLTLRFSLATVLIGPVGLWRWWSGDRSRRALVGGLIMGLFLAAAYIFQTFGLSLTTASNAGFITGLTVVLVPLLQGLIWRVWARGGTLVGVGLAVVGLFLLSGAGERTDSAGNLLVLLCAAKATAHKSTSRLPAESVRSPAPESRKRPTTANPTPTSVPPRAHTRQMRPWSNGTRTTVSPVMKPALEAVVRLKPNV